LKQLLKFKENISEIRAFAFPVFIEQLSIAGMSVIFTIMVSRIGPTSVAGFSLVESLNLLIQQFFLSLEIGATVVVSQYCGRGDRKSAGEAAMHAMLTSVSIATVLCVFLLIFPNQVLGLIFSQTEPAVYLAGKTYFTFAVMSFPFLAVYAISTASIRGSGNPKLSLISVISMNLSFAILGLIFIMGFDMGIMGAGLALLLSRMIGSVVGILLLRFGNCLLDIKHWIPQKINWDVQKSILLIGIPASIEQIIFLTGKLTTQTFVAALGTTAMAVNALASSINVFYNIPGGTAASITVPIVGKYIGMKNSQNAKDSSRLILFLNTIALSVLSGVFIIFARQIAEIYTQDPEIINGMVKLSRITFTISPIIWTFSFITPAVLRASGDMNYTASVAIISMLLFRITFGYLLAIVLGYGVIGIWIGMYIDWVIRGIFFGLRYFQGKWANRVILRDSTN
jgi:putative MATE family efflux protein